MQQVATDRESVIVPISEEMLETVQENGDEALIIVVIRHRKEGKVQFQSEPMLLGELIKQAWLVDFGQEEVALLEADQPPKPTSSIGVEAAEAQSHRDTVETDLAAAQSQSLRAMRNARRARSQFIRDLLHKDIERRKTVADGAFLKPGEDLDGTLRERIDAGLARLGGQDVEGLTLDLSDDILAALGITTINGDTVLSAQQFETLMGFLSKVPRLRRKGHSFASNNKPLDPDTLAILSGQSGSSDAPDAPTKGPEVTPRDLFALLNQRIAADLTIGTRPSLDDLSAAVQKTVPAGPADTTAFYDFHTLQIAWQDTWSAVFDDATATELGQLYDQVVRVVGPQVASDVEGSAELGDLNAFLADVSSVMRDAEDSTSYRAPSALAGWKQGIREAWFVLSADDRDFLRLYFRIHTSGYTPGTAREQIAAEFPSWMINTIPSYGPENSAITDPALIVNFFRIWASQQADNLLANATQSEQARPSIGRLGRLLEGIHTRLNKEPYDFDVFAVGSYNFGLINTFRQKWTPLNYQVGDLVSTMPLTPGETRTYTVNNRTTTTRTSTRSRGSERSGSRETNAMTRSQSDIVAKASHNAKLTSTASTNFDMTIGLFGGEGKSTTTVSGEARKDTETAKQNIREMTLKAAQEYKDENTLEIVTGRETVQETTRTSTITNPNNEITVTYLFYELQRRFEVSSRLDEITPVVLIAFDVPKPSDIDEDWLLSHDWVLRKVLLDPSLAVALDYIRDGLASDELSVEVLKVQWETQVALVNEAKNNMALHERQRSMARRNLRRSAELVADKFGADDAVDVVTGLLTGGALGEMLGNLGAWAGLTTGGNKVRNAVSSDLTKDDIAAAQESARLGQEWADGDYQHVNAKLDDTINALHAATEDYIDAVKRRQTMRTRVDQLRIHVKQNILYYMQAIWAHEPDDQRYFRLYDQKVIWPQMSPTGDNPSIVTPEQNGFLRFILPRPVVTTDSPKRTLHEVADLDKLLGFKGNYGIFPLRETNAITNYMAQDFRDEQLGIKDPDGSDTKPTATEAMQKATADFAAADDDAAREAVIADLQAALEAAGTVADEVVVPSGELFVEALPGAHPLLEDFKLRHRALDLEVAHQALTQDRVDTLRHLARITKNDLDDPDVDKRVEVVGVQSVTVDPD